MDVRRFWKACPEDCVHPAMAVLDQIGPDKHQEILVHDRIETARAVLAISASAADDDEDES